MLHPAVPQPAFFPAYLAGVVVMENVTVEGSSLPVLDFDVARAFRRAAILHRLNGRGPALSWRLKRAHRHLNASHSLKTNWANGY